MQTVLIVDDIIYGSLWCIMRWITVKTVGYNSGRHQNLMLNPPVLVVSGVHVAHLGDHVEFRGGSRVNKGALTTLPTPKPKMHIVFLKFCHFFAHNIQIQQPSSDAWTYLVVHWPQYQGRLLYCPLPRSDIPILHTIHRRTT
jgi:hypothetical protein